MFNKRLLSEFKENNKKVTGIVLTKWLMLIANIVLMLKTAEFMEALVLNGKDFDALKRNGVILALTLIAVMFIRSLLSTLNSRLSFETSSNIKRSLRNMIYDKLMLTGSGYKKYFQTSEVVQLSTEGVEQLETYFGSYIPQFFYSMIAPITLFAVIGTMSLKAAAVLLACVPLIPVSIIAVQKIAKRMLAKYWGSYTKMGDSFLECLQGLTTLKIYRADERYALKMDKEAENFRKITMRVLVMQLNSISVMDLIAYGGAALGGILSILEYSAGNITPAECFFIIIMSAEFFLPLRLLGSFFHIAMNGNAAADKIFSLIDIPVTENEENEKALKQAEHTVCFENITFSYEKDRAVLKDISFEAKRGITALAGESGSGKSTIVSLLMKEIVKTGGKIYIGNFEIDDIDENTLRKIVTRIGHDSYLFAGTVRDNLIMGKHDADDGEMFNALKRVRLFDFVMKSGGLNFKLSEKAANLSGGQKQRLALARAILHDTPVYIFDEATSNVDVESENAIMSVVKELAKHKIVIVISHRLENVKAADVIYVLKDGSITEYGNHFELMEQAGFYKEIYTAQKELEQFGKEALTGGV